MVKIHNPINIYSGSKDPLGAALTFPTELSYAKGKIRNHYPITDLFGNVFDDAEAAYRFYKDEVPANKRYVLYMRIAAAKFKQYPNLLTKIRDRGGYEWLITCRHMTSAMNLRWEGEGLQSPFICCISYAYKRLDESIGIDNLLEPPY